MPGRWLNCTNKRTHCEKKTSVCEPSWRPAGPSNHESQPAHFLLPVPAKEKRLLRRTISTYHPMMSYPPAAPRSHAVHHLRTPRKPIQEKGLVANLAGPSVSQGIGCRENPAGTNDHPRQLTNMLPTKLETSPGQYQPCTRLSGPSPHREQFLPPPFGDHRTCFPIPLDSISWIMILPVAFPYHPSPCTMVLPIRTITCYIIIRQ